MREMPLPQGFEGLSGKVRFVHRATATEFASSCPSCGGDMHRDGSWPDRFRMFTVGKVRAWCRKCGGLWFPDMVDPSFRPDPELMKVWQEEREQHYRVQKEMAERALRMLENEKTWLEWHEGMDERARKMWEDVGVPREWQDFWKLGYTDNKQFEHCGEIFTRPSMTIPKFDFGWHVRNIDFRLIDPPSGVGKYRPVPNLPATVFISTPNEKDLRDEVFVVEGSKKAMILSIYTDNDGMRQTIGIPSCTSWAGFEDRLKECGRVWLIGDPDATDWFMKLGRAIGDCARVVELSCKPDDAILKYGLTPNLFKQALRQAIKAV